MTDVIIRPVDMDAALQMRMRFSEPPRSREDAISVGDTADAAIHVGAFLDDLLVGVGSVGPQPLPVLARPSAWRLRGLIVLPTHQRQGIGRDLVRALLSRVEDASSPLVWCYAKRKLVSYYGGCGIRPTGYTHVHPIGGPTLLFGNDATRALIREQTGADYSEQSWPSLGAVEA